jgi:hypothetical protein
VAPALLQEPLKIRSYISSKELTAHLSVQTTFLALVSIFLCFITVNAASLGTTDLYSPIEITFNGPSFGASDAPSRDVDFWVRFQHQSGSPSYKVHGFWDGDGKGGSRGNIFRVRFCPTREGRWNLVEVYSNQKELSGQHKNDHVTARRSKLHGFWEVDRSSPGNRWYKRSSGTHQYIFGNTMYSFISETYVEGKPNGSSIARDIKGNADYFKKLRFSPIGDLYPHPTDKPFFDNSGNQTADGNSSHRPNPQWFRNRVDVAVKDSFGYDLIADLIMAGVDHRDARSSLTPSNNNNDPAPFLKYLIARYGSYPNVWFCIVNEYDHSGRKPLFTSQQIVTFGNLAKSFMAYPSPLSVHLRSHWRTDLNVEPAWNTHVIFQDKIKKMPETVDIFKKQYKDGGSKMPVIDDELSYEGAGDRHLEQDTIESHLGAFLGGGYGSTGHKSGNKLGQYFAGNFNASTHTSADNLLWLRQKIDSMTFWKMAPAETSIFSGAAEHRIMEWPGNEYVLASNSPGTISVNLPKGLWTIKVLDAVAKTETTVSQRATGKIEVTIPSSRASLLHIKRTG